jgi:aminoglycoside 6'-N-acetyltransferase I
MQGVEKSAMLIFSTPCIPMVSKGMIVRRIRREDFTGWLRMRLELWPDHDVEEIRTEMEEILVDPNQPVFVAERPDGSLGGFLEASVHNDTYGCDTKPVGYIEGWYVDADLRRQGIGGLLTAAAEAWAVEQGFKEMASDCEIENQVSRQAHFALGYEEVERLIHFRKFL